jgi:hypothetical protein
MDVSLAYDAIFHSCAQDECREDSWFVALVFHHNRREAHCSFSGLYVMDRRVVLRLIGASLKRT